MSGQCTNKEGRTFRKKFLGVFTELLPPTQVFFRPNKLWVVPYRSPNSPCYFCSFSLQRIEIESMLPKDHLWFLP